MSNDQGRINAERYEVTRLTAAEAAHDAEDIVRIYRDSWLDTYPDEDVGMTREDIGDHFRDLDGWIREWREDILADENRSIWCARENGTNTTSAARKQAHADYSLIDISSFDHVLDVNTDAEWVEVESAVSMRGLAHETFRYGVLPPVVMVFPEITVGGGVQGGAVESASFKYGQFNDSAFEYEIVTGGGEVLVASLDQNSELFYGVSGSYGSLGILTKAKIRLKSTEDFVQLTYRTFSNRENLVDEIREAVKQGQSDYIEGIVFAPDRGVVITGTYEAKVDLPVQTFSGVADPWFWRHAERISLTSDKHQELVPVLDYLFRYDRGAFWMGEYAFSRVHIPRNRLTRTLMNPVMNTKRLYRGLHAARASQTFFIQDVYVPEEKVETCLDYVEQHLGIYPLWLCPVKPTDTPQKLSPHYLNTNLIVDIGIWGKPAGIEKHYRQIHRDFERFIGEIGARKMLYAETFYNKEAFWDIYDRAWYEALREQYRAEVFPNVREKVYTDELYEEELLRGIVRFIRGSFG